MLRGATGLYVARTRTDETLNLAGLSAFDDAKEDLGLSAS